MKEIVYAVIRCYDNGEWYEDNRHKEELYGVFSSVENAKRTVDNHISQKFSRTNEVELSSDFVKGMFDEHDIRNGIEIGRVTQPYHEDDDDAIEWYLLYERTIDDAII